MTDRDGFALVLAFRRGKEFKSGSLRPCAGSAFLPRQGNACRGPLSPDPGGQSPRSQTGGYAATGACLAAGSQGRLAKGADGSGHGRTQATVDEKRRNELRGCRPRADRQGNPFGIIGQDGKTDPGAAARPNAMHARRKIRDALGLGIPVFACPSLATIRIVAHPSGSDRSFYHRLPALLPLVWASRRETWLPNGNPYAFFAGATRERRQDRN